MKRDEAKKVVDQAIEQLSEALESGHSEELSEYLSVLSRFPKYSFGNLMLILSQNPNATRVMGYGAWKELGRQVKKGEKGIGIIAPMVYRQDDDVASAADDKVIRGFKVVHVFDVSQTEGEALPEFAKVTGDPGDNIPAMEALIRTEGIQLDYEVIPGGADGVSKKGQIIVRPDLTPAETLLVLVHEYAHSRLHQTDRRKDTTKTIRETEAEAVAHVVGQALGLKSLEQSADYIQLYSGDVDVLTQSMDQVQKTAAHILEGIQSHSKREEVAA